MINRCVFKIFQGKLCLYIKQSYIDQSKILNIVSILHYYIHQTKDIINMSFESNRSI